MSRCVEGCMVCTRAVWDCTKALVNGGCTTVRCCCQIPIVLTGELVVKLVAPALRLCILGSVLLAAVTLGDAFTAAILLALWSPLFTRWALETDTLKLTSL